MLIGIDASRAGKKIKTGTEWYSYHLIFNLAKIDSKNRYILYTKSDSLFLPENLPNNFQIKILKWPFKFIWTHLRLSWEMLTSPPDILFVPAHSVPLVHRNRTIVTIHDLGFLHQPEIYQPLSRFYHRLSTWWSVNKSIKIITISNFSKKDILANYNISESKVKVIPLGIDLPDFFKQKEINLGKFNLSKPFFLFIGRIEKKKNLDFLITTWQNFLKINQNFDLVLAGSDGYGSQEIKNKYQNLKSVKFLGYISEQEKISLLKSCHSFIFPSIFEGFGLPVLEAMATGCLVLSADNTSLSEVGGQAVWYFASNNSKALLNLLMKSVEIDQEEIKKIKLKAQERAKLFTWAITADKTLLLLNQIKKV